MPEASTQSPFQRNHHDHEPENKKAPPPPLNGSGSLLFPPRPSLTSPSSLTEELSQAAKEIVNASHRLEKDFAEMSEACNDHGDDKFNNEEWVTAEIFIFSPFLCLTLTIASNTNPWILHFYPRYLFIRDRENASPPIVDPVKLIRRIGAVERAIAELTQDCEKIAVQRSKIAPAIVALQQQNVFLVRQVSCCCCCFATGPYECLVWWMNVLRSFTINKLKSFVFL